VRVIAGVAKGRRLRAAPGTRPTADAVKEALFSTLGSRVPGSRVLDLYAGSGALGIEALSRGAEGATFVERDPRAVAVIRQNLQATGLADRTRVVEGTVERFLGTRPRSRDEQVSQELAGRDDRKGPGRFDVILADPPYAEDPGQVLGLLSASDVLAPEAVVALEMAAAAVPACSGAAGKDGGYGEDGQAGVTHGAGGGAGDAGAMGLTVRRVRRYGDSAILYAEWTGPEKGGPA